MIGRATLAATSLVACTTFYDLEPSGGASSATTGSGGEGGSIPAQDGFLSRYDAAHTCSVLFACPSVVKDLADSIGVAALPLSPGIRSSYSTCVDWLSQPMRDAHASFAAAQRIVACLSVASTCDGAHLCTATETFTLPDARCPTDDASTCDASDWIDCERSRVVHCASSVFGGGASCYATGADVGCGVGLAADAEASCDGTTFFEASGAGAPRHAFDCGLLGLGCDGTAIDPVQRGCFGSTGPAGCATPFQVDCSPDGASARVCTSHGVRAEIDCSAEGGTCAAGPGSVRCVLPGSTCDPVAADVDVCAGSVLRACLGGRIVDFDCSAIGAPCLGPEGDLSGRCGIP